MSASATLVIGGSGFIGERLVARLVARGDEVRVFDRTASAISAAESVLGDVTSQPALDVASEGVSIIFNLAAEHRDDVRPISRYEAVNVGGAKTCVAVATRRRIETIIFTSTVAVYAPSPTPLDESGTPDPQNPYGRSKLAAEAIYREWQREEPDRRTLVILRPCAVFGAGNRGNVYNLMKQIADGRFLMVGDGNNKKSLAYVDNVAAALVFGLSRGTGCHLFNYSDAPDFATADLVRAIREALGRSAGTGPRLPYSVGLGLGYLGDLAGAVTRLSLPINSERVRKFCASTVVNSDRIRAEGFQPGVDLRSALRTTIEQEFGSR